MAGHDVLTAPVAQGADEPVRAQGTVRVIYQGGRSVFAGSLELQLRLPSFVRTVDSSETRAS